MPGARDSDAKGSDLSKFANPSGPSLTTVALYEQWIEVARSRLSEPALWEVVTGTRWTFGQLAREAEKNGGEGFVEFPRGLGASFIISTLRAWRNGRVVCPLEADQAAPALPRTPPADIVHLKLTSASGGRPRMVAFKASQLAADAANIVQTMGLRPDWPNIAAISLAHSYGFSNLVLPLLLHGIPMVLAWSALPEAIRAAASSGPAFTLPAVPALWRAWHEAGAIPNTIRLAVSAGAPLQLSTEREVFASTGLKIHNFYGSSECGGIAYDNSASPRPSDSVAGRTMAKVNCEIDTRGCLVVRSDAVGSGYWPYPEDALSRGAFRTSDLCEIVDGEIRILGRAGDVMNIAGRKLSPETVEAAILGHPGISGCIVFGLSSQDPARGDTIVACVAATAGVTSESLRQFALTRLPAWQIPREWWLREELQPNARGKISRAEWRARYLDWRNS